VPSKPVNPRRLYRQKEKRDGDDNKVKKTKVLVSSHAKRFELEFEQVEKPQHS